MLSCGFVLFVKQPTKCIIMKLDSSQIGNWQAISLKIEEKSSCICAENVLMLKAGKRKEGANGRYKSYRNTDIQDIYGIHIYVCKKINQKRN